jgi:hypothetical protein
VKGEEWGGGMSVSERVKGGLGWVRFRVRVRV